MRSASESAAAAPGASVANSLSAARTKAGERQRMRSSADRIGELVRVRGQLERVKREVRELRAGRRPDEGDKFKVDAQDGPETD